MPDPRCHRESDHLKISSEQETPLAACPTPSPSTHEYALLRLPLKKLILLLSSASFPFTLTDNAHAFMLDHSHFKVQVPPNAAWSQPTTPSTPPTGGDHLTPLTLAFLALLSSPLFLVGIPLAHLALAKAREHPDQTRAAKVLATIALALSYLGIVLIALLAARQTGH